MNMYITTGLSENKVVIYISLEDAKEIVDMHFMSGNVYNKHSITHKKRYLIASSKIEALTVWKYIEYRKHAFKEYSVDKYGYIYNLYQWSSINKERVRHHCLKTLTINLFSDIYNPNIKTLRAFAIVGEYDKYGYLRHNWKVALNYMRERFKDLYEPFY